MDGVPVRGKKGYSASFTVEATLVLMVVFLTLAAIIRNAYILHDQVTGNMILEETLEKVRVGRENHADTEAFRQEGEAAGNPRLWLGTYQIQLEVEETKVKGAASAGDWNKEIEMKISQPAEFLRKYQAIWEIGNGLVKNGS